MKRQQINTVIEQEKLVAIVRLKSKAIINPAIKSLVEGGIKILEITSNTPGYLEKIQESRELYPEILIGAGTVTNLKIAQEAIDAGAQFLVTPNTDPRIIEVAHANDIAVLMGAMTPSEISLALDYGADFIKLFPAGNLGIGYFKSIKGPFDKVKFFAVGGINPGNVRDWLEAGITGVGMGGHLVKVSEDGVDKKRTKSIVQETIKLIKAYGE